MVSPRRVTALRIPCVRYGDLGRVAVEGQSEAEVVAFCGQDVGGEGNAVWRGARVGENEDDGDVVDLGDGAVGRHSTCLSLVVARACSRIGVRPVLAWFVGGVRVVGWQS